MTTPPLRVDVPTASRLEAFADLVRSSPHNLVSRRARAELLTRHIPECVSLASMLPASGGRILDVGSGGGFPGLVIALCRPDLDVHLLDATAKKTTFLTEASAQLDVPVTVHTGRAEELAGREDLGSSFDVVTARAVAPLGRLVGWSLPFLAPGGLLYAMKGDRWAQEVEDALPELDRTGALVVATPADRIAPGEEDEEWAPRVVIVARGPR